MTEAEKKTAVLVALVKAGITDLNSFADGLVKRLPADFDPDHPPTLGGDTIGIIVGGWYVMAGSAFDEAKQ